MAQVSGFSPAAFLETLLTMQRWVAVMLGQNMNPRAVDPLVAHVPVAEIEANLRGCARR
ncbi:MAG: hypothetical protein ABI821_12850 [Pseudomonadota bacterium]